MTPQTARLPLFFAADTRALQLGYDQLESHKVPPPARRTRTRPTRRVRCAVATRCTEWPYDEQRVQLGARARVTRGQPKKRESCAVAY